MTDTVQACPNEDCESADIHPRSGNINQDSAPATRWSCDECGNEFDQPIRREARNASTHPPTHSLAAKLAEMDADEVGGAP